jgi:hypothetical protein
MEYSGYVPRDGYDEVVFRGDIASGKFIAFWMKGATVLAGMNVNTWDVTDAIESLVRSVRNPTHQAGRPRGAVDRPDRLTPRPQRPRPTPCTRVPRHHRLLSPQPR